jgi:hypothetical protein
MWAFFSNFGDMVIEGFIKLKLAHGQHDSLLLPDRIYADLDGWRFFQPQHFGPCQLSFRQDDALGMLGIDTDRGDKVRIGITRDRFVRAFDDGSQLYRCRIAAPGGWEKRSSGCARLRADGGFDLKLFHHSTPANVALIHAAGHLRGSASAVLIMTFQPPDQDAKPN